MGYLLVNSHQREVFSRYFLHLFYTNYWFYSHCLLIHSILFSRWITFLLLLFNFYLRLSLQIKLPSRTPLSDFYASNLSIASPESNSSDALSKYVNSWSLSFVGFGVRWMATHMSPTDQHEPGSMEASQFSLACKPRLNQRCNFLSPKQ